MDQLDSDLDLHQRADDFVRVWNASEIQSGAKVTLANLSYNGSIPAGGSITGIGFDGVWNGVTNAVPASFAINGSACTVN